MVISLILVASLFSSTFATAGDELSLPGEAVACESLRKMKTAYAADPEAFKETAAVVSGLIVSSGLSVAAYTGTSKLREAVDQRGGIVAAATRKALEIAHRKTINRVADVLEDEVARLYPAIEKRLLEQFMKTPARPRPNIMSALGELRGLLRGRLLKRFPALSEVTVNFIVDKLVARMAADAPKGDLTAALSETLSGLARATITKMKAEGVFLTLARNYPKSAFRCAGPVLKAPTPKTPGVRAIGTAMTALGVLADVFTTTRASAQTPQMAVIDDPSLLFTHASYSKSFGVADAPDPCNPANPYVRNLLKGDSGNAKSFRVYVDMMGDAMLPLVSEEGAEAAETALLQGTSEPKVCMGPGALPATDTAAVDEGAGRVTKEASRACANGIASCATNAPTPSFAARVE